MDRLRQQVRAAYQEISANLAGNTALQVLEEDGQPYIALTPLAAQAESADLAHLRQQLRARLPPVELAALLLEVAAFTDFTGAFTHLADGQPLSLCAVLLAQACNIGLKSVARPEVPALTLPHLVWVQHNYLRVETLTAANARLVDAQAQLPLAQAWGGGRSPRPTACASWCPCARFTRAGTANTTRPSGASPTTTSPATSSRASTAS